MALRWGSWCGALALLACSGCYESRLATTGPRDGGGAADAGSVTTSDAGGPRDAGARDAGRRDAGRLECTDPVADYVGPRCRPDTVECLSTCEDDDCQRCYDADPACLACVYQSITQCANEVRCQPQWQAFACCAEASGTCRDLEPTTILFECGGACPGEADAWSQCVNDVLMTGACQDRPTERCVR